MPLPPYPRVSFRAADLTADLVARTSVAPATRTEAALSQVADRDLHRYYHALRAEIPTFDEADASLLVDALNGVLTEPHTAQFLWAQVEDARRAGLAEKWGVDGPALVTRLRGLSYTQTLSVADACERYWPAYRDNGQDHAAALRAVGLVRAAGGDGLEGPPTDAAAR